MKGGSKRKDSRIRTGRKIRRMHESGRRVTMQHGLNKVKITPLRPVPRDARPKLPNDSLFFPATQSRRETYDARRKEKAIPALK